MGGYVSDGSLSGTALRDSTSAKVSEKGGEFFLCWVMLDSSELRVGVAVFCRVEHFVGDDGGESELPQ